MDSDRNSAATGAFLLAAAAFTAGAWRQAAALAGSGIVACIALYLLRRGLGGIAGRAALPLEAPAPVPDLQRQLFAAQSLLAESRLEFAPIALFRMPGLEPLNASARRCSHRDAPSTGTPWLPAWPGSRRGSAAS